MIIYKYTAHAMQVLVNQQVKVSTAASLNDPFELAPNLPEDAFSAPKLREYFHTQFALNYGYSKEGVPAGLTFAQYRRKYLRSMSGRIASKVKSRDFIISELKARFARIFDGAFRLFCASEHFDSILMWAHYAQNHTGCVLGIDTSEGILGAIESKWIRPVSYSKEKATIPEHTPGEAWMESVLKVAFTKYCQWEYEAEVRLIVTNRHPEFFPIRPVNIRKVVLGARMCEQSKQDILAILHEPEWGHVVIEQAKLNSQKFKLDFEVIRRGEP